MDELLPLFWGKTNSETAAVHPAVAHMLDVGVMAQELYKSFPAAVLKDITVKFSCDFNEALRLVGFLAALHDIGKISPGFQNKRPDLCIPLRKAGFSFTSVDTTQHGEVARTVLPELLQSKLDAGEDTAFAVATVLAGHHGVIPGEANMVGEGQWHDARKAAIGFLAHHFSVETLADMEELSTSQQALLAGCISVADWLASSEEHFPYPGGMPSDIEVYMQNRRETAKRLLQQLRFHTFLDPFTDFSSLFDFNAPNPCQSVLLELGQETEPPSLVILESPMGSGKTEAALAFYAAVAQTRNLRGLYCALPTQATSNAMLSRINEFLIRAAASAGAELQLLHAHASLNTKYENLRLASIGEDDTTKVAATSWFAAAKRGLLAGCGVGTIDQALLAALKVRHFFVRLFGLSGKLLLLDEIHAYDAYMDEEIKRLLGWARVCGLTVVLLSATLPQRKRHQFIRAFAPEAEIETAAAYPCVSSVYENGDVSVHNIAGFDSAELHVVPCSMEGNKADTVASILNDALPGQGCAACIMNTVADAQEVYCRLQNEPGLSNCPMYLFHARFSMERRLTIEQELLSLFGKHGDRPARAVVVATQVIEQSLDLDFDVMISDLAPIDLLLQRAGRMHRHERGKRLHPRILHILLPELGGSTVDFGASAYVYHADILLLTAALFADEQGDPLPQVVRLPYSLSNWIEAVYGEPPVHVPQQLQDHLEKLQLEREGTDMGSSFAARVGTLEDAFLAEQDPEYLVDLSNENDDDLLAHSTREGRESFSVIILSDTESVECPDQRYAQRLFSRVLSSDNPLLVRHFKESEPPESWKQSALLRHCRPLVFRSGEDTAGLGLHYDEEIGLQFLQKKRGK